MMSAGMAGPLVTESQPRCDCAESWAKVLRVSYGGLPVGMNELPFTSTDSFAGTLMPATLVSLPHASTPLIAPVPFFTIPEKLTSAPITFSVDLFQLTNTPTVRVAYAD